MILKAICAGGGWVWLVRLTEVFSSPAVLRLKLMDSFREKVPSSGDFPVGYITKRGNSKRWIEQPADLNSMGNLRVVIPSHFFVMENPKNQVKKRSKSESLQLKMLIPLMVIMNSKSRKSHLS